MPPTPLDQWPIPKFVLEVEDLGHEGAQLFFSNIQPYDDFKTTVLASFTTLYTLETVPRKVEESKLCLKPMQGVAYTCGTDTHKQIHFSLGWIKDNAHRARDEIMGVLTHEVVHCFQFNAHSTCPGGLIEGIADFVRLHASLAPPHWHRTAPTPSQKWDAGYEKTAYFLDWISTTYGPKTIPTLNLCFQHRKYHRRIFRELTGRPLRKLWALYRGSFATGAAAAAVVVTPDPPAESESEDEGYDQIDHRSLALLTRRGQASMPVAAAEAAKRINRRSGKDAAIKALKGL